MVPMTAITDPKGLTSLTNWYDANGRVQFQRLADDGTYTFAYTLAGSTVTQTQGTDTLLSRVTAYTYDSNGNVLTLTDPEFNTTTFTYNDVARTTTITNPLSKQTVIQYNTAGQPTTVTDPLSHSTSFGYDSQGHLTTTTDAVGNVTTW